MVWPIFVFYIVLALINFLGIVALFVGLFVTIPITYLADTYIYRKLKEANFGADPIITNSHPEDPMMTPTPPEIN